MNFIFSLPAKDKISLSASGLNIYRLLKKNGKRPPYIYEILYTLSNVKTSLEKKDDFIIYDICESRFFKKATLFRGVYPYKTNFIPEKIISIIQNTDKRNVIIYRIDLMINILTATATRN